MSLQEILSFSKGAYKETILASNGVYNFRVQLTESNKIFVHIDKIKDEKFTRATFNLIVDTFYEACDLFKEKGYKYIFAYIPEEDNKVLRLAQMLGFIQIQELHDDERVHQTILRKDL